jgi:hypothetical protein
MRAIIVSLVSLLVAVDASRISRCKTLPTDKEWPSSDDWFAFNGSVDGNLIKVTPIGLPCFNPSFDATECKKIQDNWNNAHL